MNSPANGRIRLSWAQVVWAVAALIALGSAYADLRARLAAIESSLTELKVNYITRSEYEARREAVLKRLDIIEEHIRSRERP